MAERTNHEIMRTFASRIEGRLERISGEIASCLEEDDESGANRLEADEHYLVGLSRGVGIGLQRGGIHQIILPSGESFDLDLSNQAGATVPNRPADEQGGHEVRPSA